MPKTLNRSEHVSNKKTTILCCIRCHTDMSRDDDPTNNLPVFLCYKCGNRVYPTAYTFSLGKADIQEELKTIIKRREKLNPSRKKPSDIDDDIDDGAPLYCLTCLEKGKHVVVGQHRAGHKRSRERLFCDDCKRERSQEAQKRYRERHPKLHKTVDILTA